MYSKNYKINILGLIKYKKLNRFRFKLIEKQNNLNNYKHTIIKELKY